MWTSTIQFITRHRLTVVLITGTVVFFGSGLMTYYWGEAPDHESSPIVKQQSEPPPEDEGNTGGSDETGEDTMPLETGNWESFLAYEGERTRMLGIKRSHQAVNFRRGPDVDDATIATPGGSTLLQPIDRLGQWYRSRLPDGTVGWIHRSLVREIQVPDPVAKKITDNYPPLEESTQRLIPEEFLDRNRVTVTDDAVNVRQGPGTQFNRIGRIYKFEESRLLARQGNWYRIETINHDLGWIHTSLADTDLVEKESFPEQVILRSAQLRLAPQFQFRSVSVEGDTVSAHVIDEIDEWYQVELENGDIGWILKDEIINKTEPNRPRPQPRSE